MSIQVCQHRGALSKLREKLEEGCVTLGFIGGSITDARPRHNWPEPVTAWLVDRYPQVRFTVENAAIGATGSDLAVLRAERDLIERGCDIVFVEYAVNDNDTPTTRRMQTREGLIRKLLRDGSRDVVLVYTYCDDMYDAMMDGRQPESIRELELLGEHYGLGSVWMGLHALEQVKRGLMRWEEWLPDGLHPTSRGSYAYGESVIAFLQQELDERSAGAAARVMPGPLEPMNWEKASAMKLTEVSTTGPWTIRRWPYYDWIDQVLETAAVGASLSLSFEGRGLTFGFDFGRTSSEFRYRIDGGDWRTEVRERPDWAGADGWFKISVLDDALEYGLHTFELEVMNGRHPGCSGTNFRLGLIGVIR